MTERRMTHEVRRTPLYQDEVLQKQHNASNKRALTFRLLLLVLISRPLGNLSLAWGTRHLPQTLAANPLSYILAMANPFVAGGICLLLLSMLWRMALLSVADLSYVVPLTALGYVFSTALGKFFLHEDVSALRWAGTVLIFLGTALVGMTRQKTVAVTNSTQ